MRARATCKVTLLGALMAGARSRGARVPGARNQTEALGRAPSSDLRFEVCWLCAQTHTQPLS